jgi:hypothetical protein
MSNSADLQGVLYNVEAAYCEDASTFGTALNLVEVVDLSSCAREKAPVPFVGSYPFEGVQHILQPFDGKSVRLKMPLTGLGATAAGAVPSSDLVTLLGLLIGNAANALATGGTLTGGTAGVPTTSMADGAVAGAMVRAGALADGRFGGHFHPLASHATSNLTLLLNAAAAPTNGDVLYSGKVVYPSCLTGASFESTTGATIRLRVLTSNGHYDLRGCFLLSAPTLSGLSTGETPMIELELGVGHVDTVSSTFPSATAPQRHAPNPVASGAFVIQQVGTATRALEAIRSIEVDLGFSGAAIKGPGGNFEGQIYQLAKRIPGKPSLTIVVDKEATGTDTWWDRAAVDPNTAPYYHASYSACCADGRAIGIYWPRLAICAQQPIQINDGGWNRQRIKLEAQLGATRTTDLTASPYRLAFA